MRAHHGITRKTIVSSIRKTCDHGILDTIILRDLEQCQAGPEH